MHSARHALANPAWHALDFLAKANHPLESSCTHKRRKCIAWQALVPVHLQCYLRLMCGTVPVVTCSCHTLQCTCHACTEPGHTLQCLHGAHTECISLIKQTEAGMRAKARDKCERKLHKLHIWSCTLEVAHWKLHIWICTSCREGQ